MHTYKCIVIYILYIYIYYIEIYSRQESASDWFHVIPHLIWYVMIFYLYTYLNTFCTTMCIIHRPNPVPSLRPLHQANTNTNSPTHISIWRTCIHTYMYVHMCVFGMQCNERIHEKLSMRFFFHTLGADSQNKV